MCREGKAAAGLGPNNHSQLSKLQMHELHDEQQQQQQQ